MQVVFIFLSLHRCGNNRERGWRSLVPVGGRKVEITKPSGACCGLGTH